MNFESENPNVIGWGADASTEARPGVPMTKKPAPLPGGQTTEILEKQNFDVIISDISMPGMDGLALLRAVRERDLDVPVLLMTGDPQLETAVKALEYGALRYLVKSSDEPLLP